MVSCTTCLVEVEVPSNGLCSKCYLKDYRKRLKESVDEEGYRVCDCGCGEKFLALDAKRRVRKYIKGHTKTKFDRQEYHNRQPKKSCSSCGMEARIAHAESGVCHNCYAKRSYRKVSFEKLCSCGCNQVFTSYFNKQTGKFTDYIIGHNRVNHSSKYQKKYGPYWLLERNKARKNDNYTCQCCGMTEEEHKAKWGTELDVHHVIPFAILKSNKLTNLICFCKSCHAKIENKYTKELIDSMLIGNPKEILSQLFGGGGGEEQPKRKDIGGNE